MHGRLDCLGHQPGDSIVWGTSTGDSIVWGTRAGDSIVWGNCYGRLDRLGHALIFSEHCRRLTVI